MRAKCMNLDQQLQQTENKNKYEDKNRKKRNEYRDKLVSRIIKKIEEVAPDEAVRISVDKEYIIEKIELIKKGYEQYLETEVEKNKNKYEDKNRKNTSNRGSANNRCDKSKNHTQQI